MIITSGGRTFECGPNASAPPKSYRISVHTFTVDFKTLIIPVKLSIPWWHILTKCRNSSKKVLHTTVVHLIKWSTKEFPGSTDKILENTIGWCFALHKKPMYITCFPWWSATIYVPNSVMFPWLLTLSESVNTLIWRVILLQEIWCPGNTDDKLIEPSWDRVEHFAPRRKPAGNFSTYDHNQGYPNVRSGFK